MEPGPPQNPEDPSFPKEPASDAPEDPGGPPSEPAVAGESDLDPQAEAEEPSLPPAASPPVQEAPEMAPPSYGPAQAQYPPARSMSTLSEPQSNYPRFYPTSEGPVPPGPPTVRFGAIGDAWNLIQQDFGVYSIASLILVVLSILGYYALEIPLERFLPVNYHNMWIPYDLANPAFWGWWLVIFVASRIIPFFLGAGYFSLCIKRLRGERISVWQVFSGFKPFFGMLVAGIITLTLEAGGCLLFLLPGMFIVGVLAFVPQIMMDQKTGPAEAMRMSFMALKRDWALMWLLAYVVSIIAFAGTLACGVGVVFTAPLYYMVLAIHYHAYFPAQGGPQRVPVINAAPQLA